MVKVQATIKLGDKLEPNREQKQIRTRKNNSKFKKGAKNSFKTACNANFLILSLYEVSFKKFQCLLKQKQKN